MTAGGVSAQGETSFPAWEMAQLTVVQLRSSRRSYGPERVIAELVAPLAEHGVTASLLALYRPRAGDPAVHPWIAEARTKGWAADQLLDPRPFSVRTARRLAERLHQARPDILHSHDYRSNMLGGLVARRLAPSLPWVATVHLHTSDSRRLRMYRTLDLLMLRLADHVVTVSRDQRRLLLARGIDRQRLCLIPPAVAADRFADQAGAPHLVRTRLDLPTSAPLVTLVGRLTRQKGVDLLLLAARELRPEMPTVHYLVVGDGPERLALHRQARDLGVAEAVHFLGYQAQVAGILGASSVIVLPSRSEGLPVVLLESLALARPVVASAVGGIRDVVRDGVTGLLIPPDDPQALATGLRRLLADAELASRLGAAGQAYIEQHCSPKRAAHRLASVYRQVLSERRQCASR